MIARLIVISGPSGAGKGTLIAKVVPRFSDMVASVSATTRAPRVKKWYRRLWPWTAGAEREGREYFFISREEFERRAAAGEFLEWAEYSGNLYGTPAAAVRAHLDAGRDVILEIELQGARQVLARDPDAVIVFIAPPGPEELEERLRRRGTESEETLRRRLEHARIELEALARDSAAEGREFDYVIVNDDVEIAADQLQAALDDIRAHDPSR